MPFDVTLTRTATVTVSLPDEPSDWTDAQLERALNGAVAGKTPVDNAIAQGAVVTHTAWSLSWPDRKRLTIAGRRKAAKTA